MIEFDLVGFTLVRRSDLGCGPSAPVPASDGTRVAASQLLPLPAGEGRREGERGEILRR
jgi:hypothetical protein